MRPHSNLLGAALMVAAGSLASAQQVMIGDSSNDRIMLFSAVDGSIVNLDFIPDDPSSTNYNFSTPKDAIQVLNEIWVADQLSDQIIRFDLAGNWIATISGGLDNMRGMEFANNTVYVCNDGSGNGAPPDSIIMFDTAGNNLGNFPANGTSPFDVFLFNSELLISDSSTDDIDRHDLAGNFIAQFNVGSSINFPEQLNHASGNQVLAAGFSSPAGIYWYDSTGTEVRYEPAGSSMRGVYELQNGNILYTNGSGVHTFDPVNNVHTPVLTGITGAQYINELGSACPQPVTYCTAKTTSTGCTPAIGWAGTPTKSGGPGSFDVTLSATRPNKAYIYFYSINTARNNVPFQGGFLCMQPPVRRTPVVFTSNTGECTSGASKDFGAIMAAAGFIAAGDVIRGEWWGRDTPGNSSLSNAIEFTVCP